MKQSWLSYFRANQAEPQEIPWDEVSPPSEDVGWFLIPSLQQFQLGEGARGVTFLTLGRRHAEATGDFDFVETLALFIAEEQRHSALLARYLRAIGATLVERDWVDSVFRKLRKLAGLECMVTVLVTAEIVAIPYYRSVMKLTDCPALKAVCRRILREEAKHLLFQASTLRRLQRTGRGGVETRTRNPAAASVVRWIRGEQRRPAGWVRFIRVVQQVFMTGTCITVWAEHRRVLKGGGTDFLRFALECRALLRHVQKLSGRPEVFHEPTSTAHCDESVAHLSHNDNFRVPS
jgi:rubrerythrin